MKNINFYSKAFSSVRKHYFLDIKKTRTVTTYPRICAVDELGERKYVNSSVIIFDQDFKKLIQAFSSFFHHAAYLFKKD